MMTNDYHGNKAITCRTAIRYFFRILGLTAAVLGALAPPLASRPLEVGDTLARERMGAHLDYYIVRGGKAGIRDISSRGYQDKFLPLPKDDYGFGSSAHTFPFPRCDVQ